MKKIDVVFNPEVDINSSRRYERIAARGIIKRDDKVLFIYSPYWNDYMLPGGGVEEGEVMEESLLREMIEEAGCINPYVIKEIGFIEEFHSPKKEGFDLFYQKSYYFLCECEDFGEPQLEDYEKKYGYENVWLTIDEAIFHNHRQIEQGNVSVAKRRANTILNYIKNTEV